MTRERNKKKMSPLGGVVRKTSPKLDTTNVATREFMAWTGENVFRKMKVPLWLPTLAKKMA
jgi:hypothetical protein